MKLKQLMMAVSFFWLPLLSAADLQEIPLPEQYAETVLPSHTHLFQKNETSQVLLQMMEKAQSFENLTGPEKKQWVMCAFKDVVAGQPISDEKKQMLMSSAPNLIDTLKAAFNHNTENLAIPHTVTNVPGICYDDAKEKLIIDQMHMLYVSFKDGLQMHDIAPAIVTTFHMVEEFLELTDQERHQLQIDLLTELLRRVFPDYANVESVDHLAYGMLLPLAESSTSVLRLAYEGAVELGKLSSGGFFSEFIEECSGCFSDLL